MKQQTIKEFMEEAIAHYTRDAEYERKRAKQATDGSSIQIELLMAAKFNEGRANAYKEMLALIG